MILDDGNDLVALLVFVPRVPNAIPPFLATVFVPSPWSMLVSRCFSAARWRTLATNGDCSRDTGLIQHVHDEVRRGFVDGLQLGSHATYPMQDAHGSALASAPDRHSFASCDSVGSPAPPHSMSTAVTCRQEM